MPKSHVLAQLLMFEKVDQMPRQFAASDLGLGPIYETI